MANEPIANGCITDGLAEKFGSEEALKFAKRLYIHGGNISNWNRIKRKTTPSSADELSEIIGTTLSSSMLPMNNNEQEFIPRKAIRCVNKKFVEKIERGEREHLKISVKVFAIELKPAIIQDALFRAMCELGVESVETLFLALPEMQDENNLEMLKSFWEEMESLLDSGYVDSLGVCDLDKTTLEKLYQWARIKPAINQVNLASCCVMPTELVAFSEKHDIQLLTHADPKDILTRESLEEVLTEGSENGPVQGWRPMWALRYSVLVKCRGVIKNKGYIVSCEKD